ncbi:hypothetical protein HWV62_2986 [Athelia sp. TMB]|nr:hypothetical protein HWV62_2986 [Athelia sp. TMB]
MSTDRSVLPASNEDYGTQEYWEERYKKENGEVSFDWFLTPERCLPIMHVSMYDQGWKNIVNIDYSSALIAQMKDKHSASRPEMEWHEMDIRKLTFEDDSFDVALDKGTMDALMTGKGDVWDPSEEVVNNVTREVSESLRIQPRAVKLDLPSRLECFGLYLLLNLSTSPLGNLIFG